MDPIQRRTIVGMTGLVALWVVVYWAWQPRSDRGPTVTFTEPAAVVLDDEFPPEEDPVPDPVVDPVTPIEPEDDASVPTPDDLFGPPPFRWIVARDGDTFEKIALRELGKRSLWRAIARANPLKDPERLRAGDRIKVPLDPENPQGKPETAPELPPAPKIIEYTVQPGDTLSGIASKFYGSVRFVDFLFDANRDRLSSPDALQLNQVIVVPPKPNDGSGG